MLIAKGKESSWKILFEVYNQKIDDSSVLTFDDDLCHRKLYQERE